MNPVDQATMDEIREIVFDFFAEECEVARERITDDTNIIADLDGDSLMLLSLLEMFRQKYGLTIELKTLARHLMKRPAATVGQVVALTALIVQHGNDLVHVDL
jgi:acyl carrier protein